MKRSWPYLFALSHDLFAKPIAAFADHALAAAGRLREHRAACGAEFGFLPRHAIGHPRLVGDFVRTEAKSVVLARLFLLRSCLAEGSGRYGQRRKNDKESEFYFHSVKPLMQRIGKAVTARCCLEHDPIE
jgi:hypothetical protein